MNDTHRTTEAVDLACEILARDCNHHVNGSCMTLACMAKTPGDSRKLEFPIRFVGCENYRAIAGLRSAPEPAVKLPDRVWGPYWALVDSGFRLQTSNGLDPEIYFKQGDRPNGFDGLYWQRVWIAPIEPTSPETKGGEPAPCKRCGGYAILNGPCPQCGGVVDLGLTPNGRGQQP